MHKTLKRSLTATVAGFVLAGAVAMLAVSAAFADSPPAPPSRFVGSVTVNGTPATAGTSIEAHIGSTTCGVTSVFLASGQSRYTLDSPALDPGATPNCGTDGASVTFWVGGVQANETGAWHSYQLNTVNLTVSSAAATPTTTAVATPTKAAPSVTPIGPSTGSGVASTGSSSSTVWVAAALGLIILGAGAGTLTVVRRRL